MEQMLWIGCLESDKEFENKAKKGANLASAQISQKNIINGIEEVTNLTFDSINGSILPPFPIYSDKYVKEKIWQRKRDSFNISVGYKNKKYINRLYCKYSMIFAAKEWIKKRYKGNELNIFVYSMRSAPMATACYIKKKIPNAKIYLIVTDLPQFMDLGESNLKKFLKKIDWIFIKKYQKKFDGFVLYAKKMAEFLKIPKNKWILMEGSYDVDEQQLEKINMQENKKSIMYSGKLDLQYGIDKLLNAFMKIDDKDIELWLTGGGNADKYIKECSQKDERIKFFGFLPNREEVLKLQSKATCLINMRLPSEEASNYCFPSKLFEYMATGIPVMSFRLGGIPDEYLKYIIEIEEENEESISEAIKKVLCMSEIEKKELGEKAKKFILKNKNNKVQVKKILKFINKNT